MFKSKLTFKNIIVVLSLFGSLVWLTVFSFPDNQLHLVFCDVGQGDAVLITKGFEQILIDGGPNDKVLNCLANNMPFFDRTVEVIALTHPEADHLTGLLLVLDKYQVNYFLTGPEGNESAVYQALIDKLEIEVRSLKCEAGIGSGKCDNPKFLTSHFISSFSPPTSHITKVINPYSGDKIKLGDIILKTLWPEKNWIANKLSNTAANFNSDSAGSSVLGLQTGNLKLNQFSLVFLLQYKDFSALLMGDADSKVQNDILLFNSLSSLDILKFPHHGSKTGMAENFLATIKPKEAVISVGQNSYGHPTSEALDMLKKFNVTIRRTDLEGEIKYVY